MIKRWLPITPLLFLFLFACASAQAQGKPSQAKPHQPASQRHTSHPSHPMRNVRPKRHALGSTGASLIAVNYFAPQQASSTAVSKSSASPASGSKSSSSKASGSKSSGASTTTTSKKKKSSSKKSTHHARREPTQKAPTPERISEIQSSLARGGYYQGEPNGKWDANTVGAMQKFQSDHGLDPSGKLDATSLQKLGLGSGIAGVSAPKPATTAPTTPAASQKPSAANPAPVPANTASSSSTNGVAANNTTSTAAPASGSTTDAKPPQR